MDRHAYAGWLYSHGLLPRAEGWWFHGRGRNRLPEVWAVAQYRAPKNSPIVKRLYELSRDRPQTGVTLEMGARWRGGGPGGRDSREERTSRDSQSEDDEGTGAPTSSNSLWLPSSTTAAVSMPEAAIEAMAHDSLQTQSLVTSGTTD